MNIILIIFFILIVIPADFIYSAESDYFTRRHEYLENSIDLINFKANKAIEISLSNLNSKNEGCNEKKLYPELRTFFSSHMEGQLIKDIGNDQNIDKRLIPLIESVYKNWTPYDGMLMGLNFLKLSNISSAPILRIEDHLVGLDKFEHMFGQGYYYFKRNYLKADGEIAALKIGIFKEKTILGGNKLETGVFSYGDLSANFNGMRMWNHMLQKNDDILGLEYNLGPYIICKNNRWVNVKEIDFTNYIDDSMDEAINCSKFPSFLTAYNFTRNVKALGYICPVDQNALGQLIKKYGPFAKWIINEKGTGVINYFGEFRSKK